ncbi:zf-HC2 domain-containing protein [Mycobacterium sp. MBM]|nr:zf-HC2 domain-containing protein [Mycobacterium sp. MBM]
MTDTEPACAGDPYLTWDAGYVLGALSPADRHEFEAHLQSCARCRGAVAELAAMPALLAMVGLDEVDALDDGPPTDPPLRPEVRARVLDTVRTRRRRTRWMSTAAAGMAAALLAVGIVAVLRPQTLGLQPDSPTAVAMTEMRKVNETPINASVAMSGYSWGTRIDMACSYGDWGQRDAAAENLGMVVVGHDGSRTQIATWLGLPGATALPSGNVAMPPGDIAAVQLVSADDGKVLLEKQL